MACAKSPGERARLGRKARRCQLPRAIRVNTLSLPVPLNEKSGHCSNDFGLAAAINIPVASECRKHVLVSEILGPCLLLLGRLAKLPAEESEGLPKTVRIEIGQARRHERLLGDGPDRTGVAPVLAVQAHRPEPEIVADRDLGRRKKRIVQPPKLFRPR
jgi:hypothetical protein